jgi:DNA replication and repair protein RecF
LSGPPPCFQYGAVPDVSTASRHSAQPERVALTALSIKDVRNYAALNLGISSQLVALTGANGAGKTNLLEAISLLTPGRGLRRAPFEEVTRRGASTGWAVAASVRRNGTETRIGTGLAGGASGEEKVRKVRVNGAPIASAEGLLEYLRILWLTPAMDGLFTGPASDRRRFLDRLIGCFDPGYRTLLGQFERAMQQRNRLLADDVRVSARFEGFERVMAEAGVAIAAARVTAVAELVAAIEVRRVGGRGDAFPWAEVALIGTLEAGLAAQAAIDVEDDYCGSLGRERERDRAAGRTLDGPHRSDLAVGHGPKEMPAKVCSTGEQKALLIGLVLAQADLVGQRSDGAAPILLLDEITAHLDPSRRAALFEEIVALGSQAWMSGTDPEAFSGLGERAQMHRVEDGRITASA